MTNKLQPRLRFKGFTELWTQRQLGDIADFFDEQRIPVDIGLRKSGPYPYYGATGIIDYVDDYIFDGEYVLLAEDGANIIDRNSPVSYLTTGKFWLNNHAHIMKSKSGNNRFLLQVLERQDYLALNTGTAQPKLNSKSVKSMEIGSTGLSEQSSIGEFFRLLDDLITPTSERLSIFYVSRVPTFNNSSQRQAKSYPTYVSLASERIGKRDH